MTIIGQLYREVEVPEPPKLSDIFQEQVSPLHFRAQICSWLILPNSLHLPAPIMSDYAHFVQI